MAYRRAEGLPCFPGNGYIDPTWMDFRRQQTFQCKNGYRMAKTKYLGIGCNPLPEADLTIKDVFAADQCDPYQTYGKPKTKCSRPFIPAYVGLQNKVLKFCAYTKETVNDSQIENYRVRQVEITYHLEDDTITVFEPQILNSGLPQGTYLRRHRIPKNDLGETWDWKDLNLSCDVTFYNRVFRIVNCDIWTKDFYESEGIILNDGEELPKDPYMDKRITLEDKKNAILTNKISSIGGCHPSRRLNTCLNICDGGKKVVLVFHCVWDDRHTEYGRLKKYELLYHLEDEAVEVRESATENEGIEPSKCLLHKIRLPKNYKDLPREFPLGVMEPTEKEYVEYYGPRDFTIGATIMVFGRRFLIYDMSECTKQFYKDAFGHTDFTPICMEEQKEPPPIIQIPPWNGWGTPEDSIQSWLNVVPKKCQDTRCSGQGIKCFMNRTLNFGAVMDSTKPEDTGREFCVSFKLNEEKVAVYEKYVRNSGRFPGKFLDFVKTIKPGSSKDCPEYYSLHDFYIGAMVDLFGHRFCLKSADPFVYEFVNTNPNCYPEFARRSILDYFQCLAQNNPQGQQEEERDSGYNVCAEPTGESFFETLGLGMGKERFRDCCDDNPNPCPRQYDRDTCNTLGYESGVCEREPAPGNPDLFEEKECSATRPERLVPPEPMMTHPKILEEPEAIASDEYYPLKDQRFAYYNPPGRERAEEIWQRQRTFHCPAPPNCGGGDADHANNNCGCN